MGKCSALHGPTAGTYFVSPSIEFTINEYWFGALTSVSTSPNASALSRSNAEVLKCGFSPHTNLCVWQFKVIGKALTSCYRWVFVIEKWSFNWKSIILSLSFNINKVLKLLLLFFIGRIIKLLIFVLLVAIKCSFLLSALTQSSVMLIFEP